MFEKLVDRYCKLLSALMVLCLALMVVMVFGNVVARYGFNSGITESEELSRWLFIWVIFMGATVAVRERTHMGTDMLLVKLPPALQTVALALGYALMLFITWLMFTGSLAQTRINWDAEAPVTGLSMAWIYSAGVVFSVATGAMLALDLWKVLTGRLTVAQLQLPQGLEPTEADLAAHSHKN